MAGTAIKAGQAFVEVFVKDETKKQLNTIGERWKAFGKRLNAMRPALVVGGFTALAAGVTKSAKAADDFLKAEAKLDKVFGGNARQVKAWGSEFAGTIGETRQEIFRQLAAWQDLLVPMGIAPDEAERMSKRMVILTQDLAAFNNLNPAEVFQALQSGILGSSESLARFGVVAKQANVDQALRDAGIDAKIATEAEKVMARMNIIFGSTEMAAGEAIKNMDTLAGKTKALRTAWNEAWVEMGKAMLPILMQALTGLNMILSGLGIISAQDTLGRGRPGIIREEVQKQRDRESFNRNRRMFGDIQGFAIERWKRAISEVMRDEQKRQQTDKRAVNNALQTEALKEVQKNTQATVDELRRREGAVFE